MPQQTFLKLLKLKLVLALGFPFVGSLVLGGFVHLSLELKFLAYVVVSLLVECALLGFSKIRTKPFVPHKKIPLSEVGTAKHFLRMRKAKIVFLTVGLVGVLLNVPFHFVYLPLSALWISYIYGFHSRFLLNVIFEFSVLDKDSVDLEFLRDSDGQMDRDRRFDILSSYDSNKRWEDTHRQLESSYQAFSSSNDYHSSKSMFD